jgi:hypothetical protein
VRFTAFNTVSNTICKHETVRAIAPRTVERHQLIAVPSKRVVINFKARLELALMQRADEWKWSAGG